MWMRTVCSVNAKYTSMPVRVQADGAGKKSDVHCWLKPAVK